MNKRFVGLVLLLIITGFSLGGCACAQKSQQAVAAETPPAVQPEARPAPPPPPPAYVPPRPSRN